MGPITKPYDWLVITLVLHILVFYAKIATGKKVVVLPVKFFFLYLLLLLFYSVFILDIETKVSLSVFRIYLFCLFPVVFITYEPKHLQKALNFICFFTFIAAIAYLLQSITGRALLSSYQSDVTTSSSQSTVVTRYYNLPFYTLFAFIFYSNSLFRNFNKLTLVYIIILFGAILLSFNRNTLLVAIISLLFVYFHNRKVNLINVAAITLIGSVLLYAASSLQSKRLNSGTSDIQALGNLSQYNRPSSYNQGEISSTEFRILHFYERYLYVEKSSLFTYLTGIGLINEQSHMVRRLDFSIGTQLPGEHQIAQVDTSDIVWSLFVLQVGMIGLCLILWIILKYLFYFFKYRINDLPFVSMLYIGSLLMTSFFGIEIVMAPIVLLYSMLYITTLKLVMLNEVRK